MASAKPAKVPVLGKTTKADVPAEIFGEDFHQSLVHEAARADANSRRRGTASTLTRGASPGSIFEPGARHRKTGPSVR